MAELKRKISASDMTLIRERGLKMDPTYFQRDAAIKQLAKEFDYTELVVRNFVATDHELNFPLFSTDLSRKQRREKAVIKYLLIFGALATVVFLIVVQMPYLSVQSTDTSTSIPTTSTGSTSQNSNFESCKATLQPKMEKCLEVQPEENWGLCKATYFGAIEECMAR